MITLYFFDMKEMSIGSEQPAAKSDKKRFASKIAKAIARYAAAERFDCDINKLRFAYSEKGKPYIEDLPDFYFNITHSGDIVAVAAAECEVGVDAEKIRPLSPAVAKRFFTEDENRYIASSPCPQDSFFEIWTAKEAFFKRDGSGIGKNLLAFSATEQGIKNEIITFKRYGYYFSVCCEKIPSVKLVNIKNTEKFISK